MQNYLTVQPKYDLTGYPEKYVCIGSLNFVSKKYDHFTVLEDKTTGLHYLDIWHNFFDDKYLVEVSAETLREVVAKYTQPNTVPGIGEANFILINRLRMDSHRNYVKPAITDDVSNGWHETVSIIGRFDDINDIAQFENSLLFFDELHSSWIKQMTAHYNAKDDNQTVAETKYSGGIIEFNWLTIECDDGEVKAIIASVFFKGSNVGDVPVDVQMFIDRFSSK